MSPAKAKRGGPDMSEALAPLSELTKRRDRFLQRMVEANVDVAIITSPLNIYYLTGIELGGFVSPQALVLTRDGGHTLIVRLMEMTWQEYWSVRSWCVEWISYGDSDDPYRIMGREARALLGPTVSGILGAELNRPSLSYQAAGTIADGTSIARIVGVSELVEGLRRIKSATELAFIRRAGDLTLLGLRAQLDAVRAGASDAEAVGAAYLAMLAAGSSLPSDPPFLAVGPSSARAHVHWSHLTPQAGEIVTPSLSASYGRYHCPIERTYVLGEGSEAVIRVVQEVTQVTRLVLERLRPGMTSAEADGIARSAYVELGLETFFRNRLAYSFGIAYPPAWWENEIMQLRPGDERILEPGMVFHLVPCLLVPEIGFVNQSMPIVITESGCDPLIDLPLGQDLSWPQA